MCRLITAALFLPIAGYSLGQSNPSSTPNDSATLRTTTRLVVVPTLVQAPANNVVYSLSASDFLLTDNGAPQKISLDETANSPLSLVVLIQTGGAAVHEFNNYRNLEVMLATLLGNPPNQVAIVNFDSRPEAASPFTSDVAQWAEAIDHPDPGDSGAAILDSIKFGLGLLNREPSANRRAILLISQTYDVGSKTTQKEILRILGETNTAIYALTFSPQKATLKDSLKEKPHGNPPLQLGNGTYYAYFNLTEPVGMLCNAMRKNAAAELAQLSGGESAQFDNQIQLDNQLGTLTKRLRNQYMLSFTPNTPRSGLHTLDVRVVNHPDFTVFARTSYWLTDGSESR